MEPVIRLIASDTPSDFDSALAATAPLKAPAMPLDLIELVIDAPAASRGYLSTALPMPCSARYEPLQVNDWSAAANLVSIADQYETDRFVLRVAPGTVNRYTGAPVPAGWYPIRYVMPIEE